MSLALCLIRLKTDSDLQFKIAVAFKIFFLLFVVIATAVGISGNLIEDEDNSEVYVTFWESKGPGGVITKTHDIACTTLRHRLRGGRGVAITACVLQFLLLIASVYELIGGPKLMLNCLQNLLNSTSLVFGLTAWAICAAMYHHAWCATYVPRNNNMKIAYGTALLVSAWCVQMTLVVISMVIASRLGAPIAAKQLTAHSDGSDFGTSDDETPKEEKKEKEVEKEQPEELKEQPKVENEPTAVVEEPSAMNAPDAE